MTLFDICTFLHYHLKHVNSFCLFLFYDGLFQATHSVCPEGLFCIDFCSLGELNLDEVQSIAVWSCPYYEVLKLVIVL